MGDSAGSKRDGLRSSMEKVGAVSAGLLVLGTLAALLDVTGWLTLVLVLLGGLGTTVAVARWRVSRRQAVAGVLTAVLCAAGIAAQAAGEFAGEPLRVAVYPSAEACGLGWLAPAAPDQVPYPPEDTIAWARDLRAIPAQGMTVRFTVDTLDNEKVTLHDIRVVTVRRAAPGRGTLVSFACGGGGVYRFMSVDLDPDPPRRTFSVEETWIDMVEAHERKAIAFPYVVSAEDPESFWVFARVKRWDVDWVLEIDWSYQGRTGVTRVDDNGTPFRVTGGGGATAECRWGPDGGLLQEVSAAGCPTA